MSNLLLVALGAGIVLALALLRQRLASFAAQSPRDYDGAGPDFDIRRHLSGPIVCDGVIYGPSGRVTSRFTGDFNVDWAGDGAVMTEHFRYDDGTALDRRWRIDVDSDGRIEARADDVLGRATGWQAGPTMQLRYRIRLPAQSGGHVLDTIDWMYLTPDGTIVNRSQFRKWGIKVAELVATMRPANAVARAGSEAA